MRGLLETASLTKRKHSLQNFTFSFILMWMMRGLFLINSCAPYEAKNKNCSAINVCKNCEPDFVDPKAKCYAVKNPKKYYVETHGTISGVQAMMSEIYQRG